ncbi:MAG: YggT family protein [Actinomycetota bacterium]|nr:putative rane protein [Cryptosporangiaceae bacterium]MDQ1675551.1 YggT family protein [Actinomycetota bacterium]
MSLVWQVIFLLLYVFLILLLARLVVDWVRMFARRWQPGRGAAVALELVYSATDPPLNALRRVIPPLRIGGMSLDLGFILLLVIVYVLMSVVGGLT